VSARNLFATCLLGTLLLVGLAAPSPVEAWRGGFHHGYGGYNRPYFSFQFGYPSYPSAGYYYHYYRPYYYYPPYPYGYRYCPRPLYPRGYRYSVPYGFYRY
jgi:hypothetical protein